MLIEVSLKNFTTGLPSEKHVAKELLLKINALNKVTAGTSPFPPFFNQSFFLQLIYFIFCLLPGGEILPIKTHKLVIKLISNHHKSIIQHLVFTLLSVTILEIVF